MWHEVVFAGRLCGALLLVSMLPGLLFNKLVFSNRRTTLLESIPLHFASSFVIISGVCLLSSIFHLSFYQSEVLWLLVFAGLLLGVWKCKRSMPPGEWKPWWPLPSEKHNWLATLSLFTLATMAAASYFIEMPPLTAEDHRTFMMSQRLLDVPAFQSDMLMYKPGDQYHYLVPVYSYYLSLISKMAGLEVIQVYCKIRFFLSLLTLATTWSLAKTFFPRQRDLPWFTLLFSCMTVLSGWGYRFTPFPATYAQFVPFPQYYDFPDCVIMPICLLLVLKGMFQHRQVKCIYLGFALAATLWFIHSREALFFLLICAAIVLGALCRSNRKPVCRLLLPGFLYFACCVIISLLQQRYMDPGMRDFSATATASAFDKIQEVFAARKWDKLLYPPPWNQPQFLFFLSLFYKNPIFCAAFVLMPWVLKGGRTSFSCLAVIHLLPAILTCVPILAFTFIGCTYYQFLGAGPVVMGWFPVSYVLVSACLYFLAAKICSIVYPSNLKTRIRFVAPAVIALILWCVCFFPFVVFPFCRSILTATIIMLSAGILLYKLLHRQPSRIPLQSISMHGQLALKVALVLFCILFLTNHEGFLGQRFAKFSAKLAEASAPPTGLLSDLRLFTGRQSVDDWRRWYTTDNDYYAGSLSVLPWEVKESMRKQLPRGAVVAAPVELLLPISALTPQYVYTCGSFVPLVDTKFFETLCRIRGRRTFAAQFADDATRQAFLQQVWPALLREPARLHILGAFYYYNAMMSKEQQPIFNKTDSVETTIAILDACHVQYVLAPPAWASYLVDELQRWGKVGLEVEVQQPSGGVERWIFLEKK